MAAYLLRAYVRFHDDDFKVGVRGSGVDDALRLETFIWFKGGNDTL